MLTMAIAPLLIGCGAGRLQPWTPYNYYIYQPHNVPMLRDSMELALDVALAHNYEHGDEVFPIPFPDINTSEIYGLNVNVAGSPIKHLGIMGGYTYYHSDRLKSSATGGPPTITSHIGEVAVGGYIPYAEYMVADFYLGNSLSFMEIIMPNKQAAKINLNKLFMQASIGFSYAPVDLAYTIRLGKASFFNMSHNFTSPEGDYLNRLAITDFIDVLEHSLTVRFGYKHVKVQVQLGGGICPREFESSETHYFLDKNYSCTASLGLHIALGRKNP